MEVVFNACDGACRGRTPISNLLFIKEANLEVGSDISLLAGGNVAAYSSGNSASGGNSKVGGDVTNSWKRPQEVYTTDIQRHTIELTLY